MMFEVKDKCNTCPFYHVSYNSTEECEINSSVAICRLMGILDNSSNSIINVFDGIGDITHVPDACPLKGGDFTCKLV